MFWRPDRRFDLLLEVVGCDYDAESRVVLHGSSVACFSDLCFDLAVDDAWVRAVHHDAVSDACVIVV